MLRHHLIIALRHMRNNKLYTALHLIGLATGASAFLLILAYVVYERSYEAFHEDADRIFRLRYERTSAEGTAVRFASCSPAAAPLIRERYPEVENIARIYRHRANMTYEETTFYEERLYFAEADFLDILRFPLIKGSPEVLRLPGSALISETTAKRYFGAADPLGKTIRLDKETAYTVKGIFEDIPANSHLKFDFLLSYGNLIDMFGEERQRAWGYTGYFTYLRLKPGADAVAFEAKLPELVNSVAKDFLTYFKVEIDLILQPLNDIHLYSHYMQEYEVNGNGGDVRLLLIIGCFIMIMAWVNYVNLATAYASRRAREVGLRRVIGASTRDLLSQFFCETAVLNGIALVIAFAFLEMIRIPFARFTGLPLDYIPWEQVWFWFALTALYLAGIFLAGLYPVVMITSFNPIASLRGKKTNASGGLRLRQALVVFQFVIAMVLLIGTGIVHRQMAFMEQQDLGFCHRQYPGAQGPTDSR